MSRMKSVTCPNCGANLSVNENRDSFFCEYCGTKIRDNVKRIDIKTDNTFRFVNQNKFERERAEREEANRPKSKENTIAAIIGFVTLLAIMWFGFGLSIVGKISGI